MKSSKKKIDKIKEALIAAHRRQEDLQLPKGWRKQVMRSIAALDRPASARQRRTMGTGRSWRILSYAAGAGMAVLMGWFILVNLDWYDPTITLTPAVEVLEHRREVLLVAEDADSGLKNLRVVIIQEKREIQVLSHTFEPPEGFLGYKGSRTKKVEIPLVLDAQSLNLRQGRAVLVATARDSSWRNWFQGRQGTIKLNVTVNPPPHPPQ